MSITSNLERVRGEIADACARAGRSPADVALMAVSKTHSAEAVFEAITAGQRLFGENRVQEFAAKRVSLFPDPCSALPDPCSFHLIGPLQNNKTTKAAELFDAIDSIAELKTAQRLNAAAQALGKVLHVLLEVKLSDEPTKHGVLPEALAALLAGVAELPSLRLAGLMTVPPLDAAGEAARPYFARLRRLRDEHAKQYPTLTALSMGMSGDFAVAIEEGSTCVRVGTAIFGVRS